MIAVIADDLTGAAEIGGIGLRFGLTVEVTSTINPESKADLLIIATDTRSMQEVQAVAEMAALTAEFNKLNPDLIFKKVDSVLRGHVIAELKAQLQQLNLNKALLVPANPQFGRCIVNGNYILNGQPIHLSGFADDPDFAITSSDVFKMLRANKGEVHIHTGNDELPTSGIIIGECATHHDLKAWCNKIDKNTLLAGGAAFFTAILETLKPTQPVKQINKLEHPALYVCGSKFEDSIQLVAGVDDNGGPVSYMPLAIAATVNPNESLYDDWADEIVSLLKLYGKTIIAINENITIIADSLREKQAYVVKKVFQKTNINELLIEGGATAAAIIKQLNINRFFPTHEVAPGVIRMKADTEDDLFLTLKPGSYKWPAVTWDF